MTTMTGPMLDTYPKSINLDEHCRICAEACRTCERACRDLLVAMS